MKVLKLSFQVVLEYVKKLGSSYSVITTLYNCTMSDF